MSSRSWIVLGLSASLGCAGFTRGEYWNESEDADADGGDAGGGDAMGEDEGATAGEDGPAQTDAAEDAEDSGGSDTASTGAPQGPSFATDILPLMRAGCESCHSAAGEAGDTGYVLGADDTAAYESTLQFCNLDAPKNSRLLTKTAGVGHTGGVIYDNHSAQYDTILTWIEQGANP